MQVIRKKYKIKIPDKINFYYCKKKKFLIVKNVNFQKMLKTNVKINIKKNIILLETKNILNKKLKIIWGTNIALIKQLLINVINTVSYKNLNLKGIGYKAFLLKNNLISLKLGYSHSIYFKIPANFKIFCLKLTKLFIKGNSFKNVRAIASLIRTKKLPEPYKGKGIVYKNEKIKFKKGKKI